jgi:hypothetical protein
MLHAVITHHPSHGSADDCRLTCFEFVIPSIEFVTPSFEFVTPSFEFVTPSFEFVTPSKDGAQGRQSTPVRVALGPVWSLCLGRPEAGPGRRGDERGKGRIPKVFQYRSNDRTGGSRGVNLIVLDPSGAEPADRHRFDSTQGARA